MIFVCFALRPVAARSINECELTIVSIVTSDFFAKSAIISICSSTMVRRLRMLFGPSWMRRLSGSYLFARVDLIDCKIFLPSYSPKMHLR